MDKTPQNILYSTDLADLTRRNWKGWCVHLVCTRGSLRIVFDGREWPMGVNDLFVLSNPEFITEARADGADCAVEMIIAPNGFLQHQLPQNSFAVAGSISLFSNPVMPLTPAQTEQIVNDFRNIAKRVKETDHLYYYEMIGSFCLTMMYDIFSPHVRRDRAEQNREQPLNLLNRLTQLLESGLARRHRDVTFYAKRLNVTPKYLTTLVRRQSGQSVTSLINRYAHPILIDYLRNTSLTLSQICEEMDFSSISYLSRYVRKHTGMTPTQFRATINR